MTYPRTESWRDDFDLEPNVHPTIAYALQHLRAVYVADLANQNVGLPGQWPFPAKLIPPDAKPAPTQPDAEDAPW